MHSIASRKGQNACVHMRARFPNVEVIAITDLYLNGTRKCRVPSAAHAILLLCRAPHTRVYVHVKPWGYVSEVHRFDFTGQGFDKGECHPRTNVYISNYDIKCRHIYSCDKMLCINNCTA